MSRSASASAGPAFARVVASSRGARQRPSATVAATRAIASGLATIWSCPIIAAARSTASAPGGHLAAGGREREVELAAEAEVARGAVSASGARRGASDTKAVLHDIREVAAEGTEPAAPPSKFLNRGPRRSMVARASTVSSTPSPARSSAAVTPP